MIRINERLKRLRDDQSGLSFTELMVATIVTSLLLIMVTSFFIQVAKITTAATQTRTNNGDASNLANEITSVLRVATNVPKLNSATPYPAIVAGDRSSLTIYSLANTSPTEPAPTKVTFTLDTSGTSKGLVTETRCVGTKSGNYYVFTPCASSTSRTFGPGFLQPTGTADQMFTYRDANGNPIALANNGLGSLTAAQGLLVGSITVTVRTQPYSGAKTSPVVLSNTVVLRNIGLDTGT